MEKQETKIPSMQERLADMQKLIGVNKYNRATLSAEFPRGYYLGNSVASADNIRRFVDAIGYLNPRFMDSEYAKTTKYGRLVAPPLFLQSVLRPYQGQGNLQWARGFYSGGEWEFFQPVLEDDRIDFNGIGLIDAKLVKSRFSGQMLVGTGICQYRNQRGEIVGLAKPSVHHSTSNEASISTGKYNELAKPYRYSEEELRKIEEDKDEEEMRGSQPRYWEDVAEGDSIGHLVIGPHTIMDTIAHATGVPGSAWKSSRLTRILQKMQAGPTDFYDPRINAYIHSELHHLDYDLGRAVGVPGAYDLGLERECLVSILFTNWMGDDGFLWKYSIQFRAFVVHGDTCWYRGKIVRKYIDNGKYCVDIEHWGDNQRGDKVTVGQATIILPSKVAGQVKYPAPRSIEDVFPIKK